MNDLARSLPDVVSIDTAFEREFELAVRDTADLAVRVAFSVLRCREDAEDVAQEAFARAYRHYGEFREREHFKAWMVRVTWRLAIDRWRSDRRRTRRDQAVDEPHRASTEQLAAASERSSLLWAAIDTLPEKLRIAIVLSAIEGHGVADVARLLQVPVGTVKSRLFLARKGLAERLQCLANDSETR